MEMKSVGAMEIIEHLNGEITGMRWASSDRRVIGSNEIAWMGSPINPEEYYVVDGAIAYRGPRPSSAHRWDGNAWKWDRSRLLELARSKRDRLLGESDWRVLPDVVTEEWVAYRAALRDLDSLVGEAKTLEEIQWPQQP